MTTLNWAKVTLLGLCTVGAMACGDDVTGGGGDASADTHASTDSQPGGGNLTGGGDAGVVQSDAQPDVSAAELCQSDAQCDDGLFCNGTERCLPETPGAAANGCMPGVAPKGTDPNPVDCTLVAACDEETDSFPTITLQAGDPCDDGIACTGTDRCAADGSCKGTPIDLRCDDGLFCNGVETCNTVLGCKPGVAPVGADSDPSDCLVPGPCDEPSLGFTLIPAALGKACDDGVACTFNDGCTGAGTCEGAPNDAFCDDAVFCNGVEVCAPADGGCTAGEPPAPGDDPNPTDCMVFGPCDETESGFPMVPAAQGESCDDGVACTTDDLCDASGACAGAVDDTLCDDGDACNGAETCDAAADCQDGQAQSAPVDPDPTDCLVFAATCDATLGAFPLVPAAPGSACDDGVACTANACDAAGVCVAIPDNAQCDDQELCNGLETCTLTGCAPGTPAIDDMPCDDQDPATGPDVCIAGMCVGAALQ